MIYSSWDIECDRLKLVIMSHFLPFVSPSTKNPKKSEFWKNERKCWRYDHFTHLYQKPQPYEVRFLRYLVNTHRHFEPFLPFYPFNNPENQNFEKMKNVSGDVIILQMCDKNHSHMMYAFQDMECDRQNVLSFWAIFCQFISLTTWKIKFSKNEKKRLFSEIWSDRQAEFFSHFGPFSSLLPTAPPHHLQPYNIPKKQNFEKMRNTWRYHHFIQVYQNHDHMLYCS